MALTDNLVSYWKLDEPNGNAADSIGSNTLTNNGTITYSAGKINNGGDLGTSLGKYFSNSNIGLANNVDYSFSLWIKLGAEPATNTQFCPFQKRFNGLISEIKYEDVSGTKRIIFGQWNGSYNYSATYNITLGTTNWYLLTIVHHNTANTYDCYLNGSAIATGAAGVAKTGSDFGTGLWFGADGGGAGAWKGMLDEIGYWSRALSADEVSQLYNSNRALAYPLTAPTLYGGVSYWKLDESSGNAADSVGSNTLTNNGTTGYTACLINNGIDLGTANSTKYLSRADALGLTQAGDRTFSVWIKMRTEQSGTSDILNIGFQGASGYYMRLAYYYDAGTRYLTDGARASGTEYAVNLGTTNWHHLVYVKSSTNFTLYVDGVSRMTGTTGTANVASSYFSAGANAAGSLFLNAYMDECGVWSRALSSTEITSLYNSGNGLQYPWAAASGPANLKSWNGLAKASIKSINGLAIASVKSVNSLA